MPLRTVHHHPSRSPGRPCRPLGAWLRGAAGAALVLVAAEPTGALAHADHPVTPDTLWSAWPAEPLAILTVIGTTWLFGQGTAALWRRAGVGRGISRWQAVAAAGGSAALAVALLSPLAALSEALFSAHMAQHLLLMLAAAPLLVLGNPRVAVPWALRAWPSLVGWGRSWAFRRLGGLLTLPLVVWGLHSAALWAWHAPVLYQAALQDDLVHALEHSSLLGTALTFWWVAIHPGRHGRLGYGASILLLFTLGLQGSLLGTLMTFSRQPWYPAYQDSVAAWHLTPLADQQLAGLLMWLPSGIVYLLAAAVMFLLWLSAVERAARQREQHGWQGGMMARQPAAASSRPDQSRVADR